MRLYLCGATATGKTTLANALSKHLGWPIAKSPARDLLRDLGYTPDEIRGASVKKADAFAMHVAKKIIEAEDEAAQTSQHVICERFLCHIGYAMLQATAGPAILRSPLIADYLNRFRQRPSVVLLLDPMRACLDAALQGGQRSAWLDWDEINVVHGAILTILQLADVHYVRLRPAPLADRFDAALQVLEANQDGVRPIRAPYLGAWPLARGDKDM